MKKDWEVKRIGDCLLKVIDNRGKTPPLVNDITPYGLLEINSLSGNDRVPNYNVVKKYVSKETYESWFRSGHPMIDDILFATVGTIGEVAILNENKGCIAQNLIALRVNKDIINPHFLFYHLINPTTKSKLLKLNISYVQPSIRVPHFLATEIPLPPLSEQKRIVTLLDEAFAAISKAKENAEKNLQNARELFESYLERVFANMGKGWDEKRLGDVTLKIGSGATPRGGNESYKTKGISLIRSMNVHDRYFKERNLAFIDDKQAEDLANVTLQENDVLLNITGASVTRCCVIPKEYLPARVNQHVSIIRPKQEIINSTFLNVLLTSKFYKDQLLSTGEQGATRQALTKVQLEDFVIHFPPLKEQQTIVTKLDALSAETKKLEGIYEQKLRDLEELKRSILEKAFSGELTEKLIEQD